MFDDFEVIQTADDVEEVKPNPELYLLAAKNLGVSPAECLAFEDSVNGSIVCETCGHEVCHCPE
nr:HAD-IA family hydrolase [Bacillus subtilis]